MDKRLYSILLSGAKDERGNIVARALNTAENVLTYVNKNFGIRQKVTKIITN